MKTRIKKIENNYHLQGRTWLIFWTTIEIYTSKSEAYFSKFDMDEKIKEIKKQKKIQHEKEQNLLIEKRLREQTNRRERFNFL
jgi:hypothetical protein